MYSTGDRPGKGRYRCVKCGEIVALDDDSDTLPPCSSCDATEWKKIS